MRLALGELLKNVDKVDDGKEVAPREVGDKLDLIVVASSALGLARRVRASGLCFEHGVLGSRRGLGGWVDLVVAEFEKALGRKPSG